MEPSASDRTGLEELPLSTVLQPQSVAEVGEIVRRAAMEGQAIYPLGGRTMQHVGLPAEKPGIGVDLRRLDRVIDYPARDMTITVQAGITVARLQEILGRENQQLPVDVPLAEQATLGGALATNASGPRRYSYGTLRDYVIGISVVNDEGQEVKAGGRVVKNVAGYDLCKLYVGSFGTLGIITQVTLKVRPVMEERAWLALGCPPTVALQLPDLIHGSKTRPVCLELFNAPAVRQLGPPLGESPWLVLVAFEEHRTRVQWQVEQLGRELGSAIAHSDVVMRQVNAVDELVKAITDFPVQQSSLTIKANLLPQGTPEFCRKMAGLSEDILIQGHAGNGIVTAHVSSDLSLERAQAWLRSLQQEATARQGNLTILRCPTAWKKSLPIWGQPRGDAWLMRAVKDKLDPRRLFNPGRFVDGI